MLNAETGVRGYLVARDPEFLEPNQLAQKKLYRSPDQISSNRLGITLNN
jgi:CHASE3 domain sensor protein